MLRLCLILVACLAVLSGLGLAQDKDLNITGDTVAFDKAKNLVEATGSVEVTYANFILHGNHVVYLKGEQRVLADRGFVFWFESITIEGESLDYSITGETGQASQIRFFYKGVELGGQQLGFGLDEFRLRQAHFTTCDLSEPHYHVTAGDINFYPKYGWLVAYWGFFWLGRWPVVPMPTYIYDMMADDKAQRNIPPFPEISSNDLDGWYINERLAWHLRREFSGSYTLSYYQKKGLGGGTEANYILDDNNRGNVRLYGNTGDGLWGGINHHYYFGRELGSAPRSLVSLFNLPKQREFEIEAMLTQRERINYQRISFQPQLVFRSRATQLGRPEAKIDAELRSGQVAEENNVTLNDSGGKLKLYWEFPEVDLGKITPFAGTDLSYYSNGTQWVKNTAGLDLRKTFSENFLFGLGYQHYFSIDGTSPFLYELYHWRPVDRLTSELFFVHGQTGVGLSAAYFLDNWSPEDIDYSLFFKLHCYNLLVKYRSLRGEFNLGFSLAGGE